MSASKNPVYSIALHFLLIALATGTVLLARQNSELNRRLNPPPPPPAFTEGEVVEPFQVVDLEGMASQIEPASAERRQRVLAFFTTTCAVCRENQERWRQLYEQASQRVEITGISFDPPEVTRAYAEEIAIPFPVVTLRNPDDFSSRYPVDRVPLTVNIDAAGKVRNSWLGLLPDEALASI